MRNSKHIKARYRRAKAFKMMGHYRRAIEDLKMVLEDDPGNKEAERELLECQHCQMFVCDTHWFYFSDPKLSALDKKGMYSAITESSLDKHRKCKNESVTPEYMILYLHV